MSTTQLLRYPLTREKILASCHGLISAGSISPSGGAAALGETTDTVGTASCLVSIFAFLLCDNRGNTPAMTASSNSVIPIMRGRRQPRLPSAGFLVPMNCGAGLANGILLMVVPFINI